MSLYLNNISAYSLFQEDFSLTYYVDKTDILHELPDETTTYARYISRSKALLLDDLTMDGFYLLSL